MSRLLADKAGCLASIDAASSGKNIVVVLETLEPKPAPARLRHGHFSLVSRSSPTAPIDYGGVDPNALKGPHVYIPGSLQPARSDRQRNPCRRSSAAAEAAGTASPNPTEDVADEHAEPNHDDF
jgi:hypothetical protein